VVTEQNFDAMRQAMVASQLRTSAVNDARVIAAMAAVPRERFVPADRRAVAYIDRTVPLGDGRVMNTPLSTGLLLTQAGVRPDDKVLLVGAATGYTAALLARLAGSVVALESDPALAATARETLKDVPGISLVDGPLADGVADRAPYDLILIDGVVETVPPALIDQLADNGRLATGLIEGSVMRLAIGRRAGAGFGLNAFADADSAILPGFEKPRAFSF
jgi:protein-L-isoaspartate(D-aspartate) O-methyltransferase